MKKKPTTAAELMARLRADPEWVAARTAEENARTERDAHLGRAEAALVDELRQIGFDVGSVWDLVNTQQPYPDAVPILLAHLSKPYPPAIREGIARALAVPEARRAWQLLKKLYLEAQDEREKAALAVAVAGAGDEECVNEIIALANDRQLGSSRLLLLSALERSPNPNAHDALLALSDDPDLREEIPHSLARSRNSKKRTQH